MLNYISVMPEKLVYHYLNGNHVSQNCYCFILQTLLDLGSSPNYKDMRGLTTLYYSVIYNSNPQLTEMLLHDHAMIGTSDPHGWQEVHQVRIFQETLESSSTK